MEHKHHHHHHHGSAPITAGKAFRWGITLNLLFVAAEFIFGWLSNSMGLMSDAGHNLSDVASMALALIAGILATKHASDKFSYGYRKSTILISVANAVILLVAVGLILIESIGMIMKPEAVAGDWIIIVAGTGVLVNGITTWLFHKDKNRDLNIRATYLHMLADTLVSVGVIISGVAIHFTGWYIIDPIVGIIIALIILISTWDLLKDSLRLALDGTPEQFDTADIKAKMTTVNGVMGIHHLHIWAVSTTKYALTCHVLIDDLSMMATIKSDLKALLAHEGIAHATLEVEDAQHCCDRDECELDK